MVSVSILISSHNRLHLLKRCLYSIDKHRPKSSFEVIVADDGSTEDVLGELSKYDFPWKFISVDNESFEKHTGIKHYHNSPVLTNNIAFTYSAGNYIFLIGNDIISYSECLNNMINQSPNHDEYFINFSTTYDVPNQYLETLDEYGTNVNEKFVKQCSRWPLASQSYRSDVTNYISLCSRKTWQDIGGYNEQYVGGIAAEDSDFVRRARCLPNFKIVRSNEISLHQYHGGRTVYYHPTEISSDLWNEGAKINRKIYDLWSQKDGCKNPQEWKPGVYGVKQIISKGY